MHIHVHVHVHVIVCCVILVHTCMYKHNMIIPLNYKCTCTVHVNIVHCLSDTYTHVHVHVYQCIHSTYCLDQRGPLPPPSPSSDVELVLGLKWGRGEGGRGKEER